MDLTKVLASDADSRVVIIDDHFAPPDLSRLDADALTRLYRQINRHAFQRRDLASLLGLDVKTQAGVLMGLVEANAQRLWDAYQDDTHTHGYLATLFSDMELDRGADRQALDTISTFCKNELQLNPLTFGSLASASEALKTCTIAFVDFRFKAGIAVDKAISGHQNYRESYQAKYEFDSQKLPKIVYLISSSLPRPENLQAFRVATGLRAAFFKPIRKSDLTPDLLSAEIRRWKVRYPAAFKLDMYLTEMSDAVSASAKALGGQLDGLELHDLAMLNMFKLAVERESLQDYLTWLLSEALASKLRSTPRLQLPLLPNEGGLAPLDGKMKLGTVLFELFSQIAISPLPAAKSPPAFGDVYVRAKDYKKSTSREVMLAITPACDMLRCDPEDEVLCVRGEEAEAKPNMEDLLKQHVLFGKGSHVVQYKNSDQKKYAYIRWGIKKLRTISAKDLSNTRKYTKVARLSELFAQEVKELALSDASRIGVPVYPAFLVSTHAAVKMKFSQTITLQKDLSAQSFECAIVTKGRTDPDKSTEVHFLAFTEQFADWIRDEFLPEAKAKFPDGKLPAKFSNIDTFLQQWSDCNVELKNGTSKSECGGALKFKFVDKIDDVDASENDTIEIVVAARKTS